MSPHSLCPPLPGAQVSLDELRVGRAALRDDVAALRSETRPAVSELRQRLGACWEGMRESRVELGDVMQTLHHLVERSEIQHVVNQMLMRAAYANAAAYGGGTVGVPKHPLISPRVGLLEALPSHASSVPPPHLPQALASHHRKCLKKGDCSCADRLAATLGAGDPRLALDRLFGRQLQLLLSVRKLWQRGEAARGALPTVPQLPPIPRPARSDTDGGASPPRWADYNRQRGARRPTSHECAPVEEDDDSCDAAVGGYCDGGVLGGGFDEQGVLGPAGMALLPARLVDL